MPAPPAPPPPAPAYEDSVPDIAILPEPPILPYVSLGTLFVKGVKLVRTVVLPPPPPEEPPACPGNPPAPPPPPPLAKNKFPILLSPPLLPVVAVPLTAVPPAPTVIVYVPASNV